MLLEFARARLGGLPGRRFLLVRPRGVAGLGFGAPEHRTGGVQFAGQGRDSRLERGAGFGRLALLGAERCQRLLGVAPRGRARRELGDIALARLVALGLDFGDTSLERLPRSDLGAQPLLRVLVLVPERRQLGLVLSERR